MVQNFLGELSTTKVASQGPRMTYRAISTEGNPSHHANRSLQIKWFWSHDIFYIDAQGSRLLIDSERRR